VLKKRIGKSNQILEVLPPNPSKDQPQPISYKKRKALLCKFKHKNILIKKDLEEDEVKEVK
jgi:hypothetical protein